MTPHSLHRPPRPDRLEPSDAALLALEDRTGAPQNVGCVLLFDGEAPPQAQLTELVGARLEALPRHLARVVATPLGAGRPAWARDDAFELDLHVRREALPGGEDALERLVARILAERLDRERPLWELTLVEGATPGGFALVYKSHAVLAGGGLVAALLDRPVPAASPAPSASPGSVALLADALASPAEAMHRLRAAASVLRGALDRRPSAALAAPPGPLRRVALLDVDLELARAAKGRLGGTVNDVVLAALAGALGAHLRGRGSVVDGVTLRALVPVAGARDGELLAAYAPLPLAIDDPRLRHAEIARALDGLRASGRAAGAEELSGRDGFGLVVAAARMAAGERGFDLVVANVPGPQQAHRLLGRELRAVHPLIGLAPGRALSVAVLSYAGRLCFGLLADGDAMPDVAALARGIGDALAELAPQAR